MKASTGAALKACAAPRKTSDIQTIPLMPLLTGPASLLHAVQAAATKDSRKPEDIAVECIAIMNQIS